MAGVGGANPSFRESAWGPRRSPSGSGHNLRGSARRPLPCAFARHPKLCAHGSRFPSAFRCKPRSAKCWRTAYPQPPLPSFGLQTFPPLTPILTQGASSRLLERAARPAVGRQCGRGVPNDHFAESGQRQRGRLAPRPPPPRRAHPEAPTPGLTGSTPSPTFQPPRTTLSAQPS